MLGEIGRAMAGAGEAPELLALRVDRAAGFVRVSRFHVATVRLHSETFAQLFVQWLQAFTHSLLANLTPSRTHFPASTFALTQNWPSTKLHPLLTYGFNFPRELQWHHVGRKWS